MWSSQYLSSTTAVQIWIISYKNFTSFHCTGRYELNKLTSLPMCGFIAQLVEHRTGIGLVSQPLNAAYWLSLVHEKWNLCRFVTDSIFITRFTLCGVSMLTMAAISVDRLLNAFSFYNSWIPLLYNKTIILVFS